MALVQLKNQNRQLLQTAGVRLGVGAPIDNRHLKSLPAAASASPPASYRSWEDGNDGQGGSVSASLSSISASLSPERAADVKAAMQHVQRLKYKARMLSRDPSPDQVSI